MSRLSTAKLALAALGVLVWAYGARMDVNDFRWAGIGLLLLAFLLRFFGPRGSRRGPRGEPPAGPAPG